MIFVTVGTHEQQFDRLIRDVEALDPALDRVIQFGHGTFVPVHGRAQRFFTFAETVTLMRQAKIVITHAGTGSVTLALHLGKRPVVAPRVRKFGEHVDDHQLDLVRRPGFAERLVPYLPGDDLSACIALAAQNQIAKGIEPDPRLVAFLVEVIAASAR